MILTVGSTKGGTGKTTVALQLALARRHGGADVLLIDADRQGSAQAAVATRAVATRAEANRLPGLACSSFPDERVPRAQVLQQAGKYDDVIIDAGGRDSAALRMAMLLSDALLVPVPPRTFEVWATLDLVALIDGAQEVRGDRAMPELLAMAFLSIADPGLSPDNTAAVSALADVKQLSWLTTPVRRRKAFANASGLGLSVEELGPRDDKACAEIAALVGAVFHDEHQRQTTGEPLNDHCNEAAGPAES